MTEKVKKVIKPVQSKEVKKPLTEDQKRKMFLIEYRKLAQKYNYKIVVTPSFVQTNHGTFEIKLLTSVGKR